MNLAKDAQRTLMLGLMVCLPLLAAVFLTQMVFAAELHSNQNDESREIQATITVSTTADELNSDGDCSLREAIQAANTDTAVDQCSAGNGWDTINVPAGNYVLTLAGSGEDNNATGDLDVLESLTIIGMGAATAIDGNGADRVFDVNPNEDDGFSFHLADAQVRNGAEEYGAALYLARAQTVLQDVQLVASTAVTNGGAIYGDGSHIQMNNSAVLTNTAGVDGGGVFLSEGALTLANVYVSANSATEDGGGIYSEDAALSVAENSEIANNQAEYGAGIYSDSGAHFVLSDSWLHHNVATYGGAAYIESTASLIQNGTIEYNEAPEDGAGLYLDDGDLTVISSVIQHNDAVDEGGGFHLNSSASVIMTDTVVFSNTASYGGGVYQDGNGLYIANSIFRDNEATDEGGAVYLYDEGGIIVEDSLFESNRANNGGAIAVNEESALSIDRSTFISNTAVTDGGAIYTCCGDYTYTTIRNSTLTRNYAGNEGGAAYSYFLGITFENSTVVDNEAGVRGGGFANPSYFGYFYNTILAGNRVAGNESDAFADCYVPSYKLQSAGNNLFGEATGCDEYRYDGTIPVGDVFTTVLEPLADNGGGLLPDGTHPQSFALPSGSPAIDFANDDFCPIIDQTGAPRYQGNACDAGAVESSVSGTIPTFSDNIINVNTTTDELTNNGNCSLREAIEAAETDTAVDSCASGDGWDTINLPSGTYSLTIDHLSVSTNTVTIRGVSAADTIIHGNDTLQIFEVEDDGGLVLEDLTLTHGYVSGDGGCLAGDYGFAILIDSVVANCEAGDGGGIEMYGHLNMVRTTIKENTATAAGGGIYNYYGMVLMRDSTLINNFGTDEGGGLGAYVGLTRISNSDVLSNTSGSSANAGGVASGYGVLIINEDSSIQYNQTDNYCGGVYGYDIAMVIDETTISHNQSVDEGGGICTDDGVWMRNSLIERNTSEAEGGGIYGGGLIQNSTIRYNTALSNTGGGFYSWGILMNSMVANNQAAEGGGVYADGGSMIINSTVRDNEALDDMGSGVGGGVFVDDYAGRIENSTIQDNSSASNGGGLFIYNDADVEVVNSTVSGNEALTGGGVYVLRGTLSLNYSTVANNTASGDGGGLLNQDTAVVQNSIVAGNSGNGSITNNRADCASVNDITFAGSSLFGNGTGCAATGPSDIIVAPAVIFTTVLGPLADNGGETETHALLAGSPAIDQIPSTDNGCGTAVAIDQRGVSRPSDGDLNGSLACDMGAFELGKVTLYLPIVLK